MNMLVISALLSGIGGVMIGLVMCPLFLKTGSGEGAIVKSGAITLAIVLVVIGVTLAMNGALQR